MLLATNQVPELSNSFITLVYHLAAEFITAFILLIAGFGLLTGKGWGFHTFLISLGLLLYTVIVSAGYYAQLGDYGIVGMFTILQVTTVFFILLSFLKWKTFQN